MYRVMKKKLKTMCDDLLLNLIKNFPLVSIILSLLVLPFAQLIKMYRKM